MMSSAQLVMPNSSKIASSMIESSPTVQEHAREFESCH
jgi:hypothetical protein